MSPRRLAVGIACAAALPVLALAAAPVIVTQSGRAFSVRELHIRAGDVVRFVNADEFLHHVYVSASNFAFDSGEQEPGKDVDVRFPTSGQFEVRCQIHPRMKLTVTVD